ncbi:MAG: FG-GAP repeat protein [Acidimicrobiales bacterium]
MRRSRLGGLLAIAATSLPLLAGTTAVAASPRTTPTIGKQIAALMGSDTIALDYFGISVATSGTTVVVGAPNHAKDAGRAYVFTNTAAGWKQAAELKGSDTVGGDYFGYSVAASGKTVVVGAPGVVAAPAGNGLPATVGSPGRAYVFTRTAAGWTQAAELKGSDTVTDDNFGVSVATSGTTAVVGAPGHASFAGRAYVFTNQGAGWKQAAELKGSDTVTDDNFGLSVATSHTTVVVGAYDHASSAGRAYVFTRQGAGWKQAAELKGSDTIVGDGFGISVATSGTTVVVGASAHANSAGRAYVFTRTATGWKQVAELKGSDTVATDFFGYSVATSGTAVVVGAYAHASFAGRAYLFDV